MLSEKYYGSIYGTVTLRGSSEPDLPSKHGGGCDNHAHVHSEHRFAV